MKMPTKFGAIRSDSQGNGHFGSPRKSRIHRGTDLLNPAGSEVFAPFRGYVTKLGYCYGDDLSYRYVEIAVRDYPLITRLLYVDPSVEKGDLVEEGQVVGLSQDISKRYSPEMINHVHWEIRVTSPTGILADKGEKVPVDELWLNPEILMGI